MIRVCAWHKQYFGFKLIMGETEPLDDKSETHGICPDCSRRALADYHSNQALTALKRIIGGNTNAR